MGELKLSNQEKNDLRLLCRILRSFGYKHFNISDGFDIDFLTSDEIIENDVLNDIIGDFNIKVLMVNHMRRKFTIPYNIEKTLESITNKLKDLNIEVKSFGDYEISYIEIDLLIDTVKFIINIGYNLSYTTTNQSSESFEITSKILNEFEELKPGCKHAIISFEGSGDSGYLDNNIEVDDATFTIPAIIEDECYELLSSYYPGWEINEGTTGKIEFDIEEKEGTLIVEEYSSANEYEEFVQIKF